MTRLARGCVAWPVLIAWLVLATALYIPAALLLPVRWLRAIDAGVCGVAEAIGDWYHGDL